jgi:hypothetical protein
MASGHVNRIYRPNTWQHRPSLRREDFSCQPGAVHTWHETDLPRCPQFSSYRGESGHGGYERRLPSLTRSGLGQFVVF